MIEYFPNPAISLVQAIIAAAGGMKEGIL